MMSNVKAGGLRFEKSNAEDFKNAVIAIEALRFAVTRVGNYLKFVQRMSAKGCQSINEYATTIHELQRPLSVDLLLDLLGPTGREEDFRKFQKLLADSIIYRIIELMNCGYINLFHRWVEAEKTNQMWEDISCRGPSVDSNSRYEEARRIDKILNGKEITTNAIVRMNDAIREKMRLSEKVLAEVEADASLDLPIEQGDFQKILDSVCSELSTNTVDRKTFIESLRPLYGAWLHSAASSYMAERAMLLALSKELDDLFTQLAV